jgi:hypothetical protein
MTPHPATLHHLLRRVGRYALTAWRSACEGMSLMKRTNLELVLNTHMAVLPISPRQLSPVLFSTKVYHLQILLLI